MPPLTALLHTTNDALRLGRALETLLPCAELLIVDHHSTDATLRVARAYGARILPAEASDATERITWIARVAIGFSVSTLRSPSPKNSRPLCSNGVPYPRKA
jgi:glycosyltransferase involved in cell wall biosynthesis